MKEQEKIIFDRLIELNKNNGLYNCKLEVLAKDLSDQLTAEQELTVREVSDEEIQSMANKYIESNRFIECANVAENSYIAGLENMRDKMNSLKS